MQTLFYSFKIFHFQLIFQILLKTKIFINFTSIKDNINAINLNQLLEIIKQAEQHIEDKIKLISGKKVIFFIGTTGSGKSSITRSISKNDVIIEKRKGNKIFLNGPGIQSGLKSVTREPSVNIDDITGIIYCGCSGFDDSEGDIQEIINSFLLDFASIISKCYKQDSKITSI